MTALVHAQATFGLTGVSFQQKNRVTTCRIVSTKILDGQSSACREQPGEQPCRFLTSNLLGPQHHHVTRNCVEALKTRPEWPNRSGCKYELFLQAAAAAAVSSSTTPASASADPSSATTTSPADTDENQAPETAAAQSVYDAQWKVGGSLLDRLVQGKVFEKECALSLGMVCAVPSSIHSQGIFYKEGNVHVNLSPGFVALVTCPGRMTAVLSTAGHGFLTNGSKIADETLIYSADNQIMGIMKPENVHFEERSGQKLRDWAFFEMQEPPNVTLLERLSKRGQFTFRKSPALNTRVMMMGCSSHVGGEIVNVDMCKGVVVVKWDHGCSKGGDSGSGLEEVDANNKQLSPRVLIGQLYGNASHLCKGSFEGNNFSVFVLVNRVVASLRCFTKKRFGDDHTISYYPLEPCQCESFKLFQ